jgi:hypothetical protein
MDRDPGKPSGSGGDDAITSKVAAVAMPIEPDGEAAPLVVAPASPPNLVKVRVSRYDPALGGVNCFSFVNGECVSKMANGQRWQDWMGVAVACVPEWPFETKVIVAGRTFICKDRGGKIKYKDGIPWIDMLLEVGLYPHGTIVDAEVIFP